MCVFGKTRKHQIRNHRKRHFHLSYGQVIRRYYCSFYQMYCPQLLPSMVSLHPTNGKLFFHIGISKLICSQNTASNRLRHNFHQVFHADICLYNELYISPSFSFFSWFSFFFCSFSSFFLLFSSTRFKIFLAVIDP